MVAPSLKKDFVKVFAYCLLAFFFLPSVALFFSQHAGEKRDADYWPAIEKKIAIGAMHSTAETALIRQHLAVCPPSRACRACTGADPELAQYRALVCPPFSEVWNYHFMERVASWLLAGGMVALLLIVALGGIAFGSRGARYRSFVFGWHFLKLVTAAETIIQGAMAIWLSYWLPVFWGIKNPTLLVVFAGIIVASGVIYLLATIFMRAPPEQVIEGELLEEKDAPRLWAHIRAVAERSGAVLPDHIVAGIDIQFAVTEARCRIGERFVQGRLLFISLPLLGLLDTCEADAVLVHELTHLKAGDAVNNARLGFQLNKYEQYLERMGGNAWTRLFYYLLLFYRMIFEIALQRDSRQRELIADRAAANQVSAKAVTHALIKLAAYNGCAARVEQRLFASNRSHGEGLDIARHVIDDLPDYVRSDSFLDQIRSSQILHPFDSHPILSERMNNVAHIVAEADYADIVTALPQTTWIDKIEAAQDLQSRLWNAFEQRFIEAHEQSLIYRLEPADEEEEKILLQHYPPVVFKLGKGRLITVTYAGLILPGQREILSWDDVKKLSYDRGVFADIMTITHYRWKLFGRKTSRIKLPAIGEQRTAFKNTVAKYLYRHQVMRCAQKEQGANDEIESG